VTVDDLFFLRRRKPNCIGYVLKRDFPLRQQDPEKACCTNQRNDDEGTGILNDRLMKKLHLFFFGVSNSSAWLKARLKMLFIQHHPHFLPPPAIILYQ
jgi:hypothetical protein